MKELTPQGEYGRHWKPGRTSQESSRDTDGFTGLHFSNLFDQDGDEAGQLLDPGTGTYINNSVDPEPGEQYGMHVIDSDGEMESSQLSADEADALAELSARLEALDEAERNEIEKWLEEYGVAVDEAAVDEINETWEP